MDCDHFDEPLCPFEVVRVGGERGKSLLAAVAAIINPMPCCAAGALPRERRRKSGLRRAALWSYGRGSKVASAC